MKSIANIAVLFFLAVAGHSAAATEFTLPVGARLTVERDTALDSFEAPIGPFEAGAIPSVMLEGTITRRAWRIPTEGLTPLQVMAPIRDQLVDAGYRVAFECRATACGGFDFRFATEVLPGPNMYVNISRYRYLTALAGPQDAPVQAVGVLVSATAASAYVQIIHADTGVEVDAVVPAQEPAPTEPESVTDLPAKVAIVEDTLLERGYVILRDLEFATGTSQLSQGTYPSLTRLATLLKERTDLRVVLVGHTDTVGGLQPNIALSRDRALAVRTRLVSEYGIAESRLDAEGMGYLAPVASNLTPEGREKNRRVEAVLLNTQ